MKKVLAISSVLLGVVFLTGCSEQPLIHTQPIETAPVTQQPEINQPVTTPSVPTTPSNNNVASGTPEQITKIIQELKVYCEKNNIPECLPITSYSIVDLNDKYSVVKIGSFNYLLIKKNDEWNVSIVSQEKNICETGSDSPDLIEYCGR